MSRRNGGVFEAVVAQAKMLGRLGAEPVVLGLREESTSDDLWRLAEFETHMVDQSGPQAFGFSPDLPETIDAARLDLLHLHGIWQYPTHAAGDWARATGKPLVISPHGMLDPWITSRNAWKKHLARALWERHAWRSAAAFHALTDAEADDIAHETRGARIATIPNPAPAVAAPDEPPRGPNALYIGRIHEKKNVAALIGAWLAARPDLPEGATLTIAGWGDDEGVDMLERTMREHREAGIEFVGTAFGSQKAALLDLARFLVLPSHSEGLPMAILEAWAAGVPTIMTEHCHLPEGFAQGAAIRCGTDSNSIREALVSGFRATDAEWQGMSRAALELASGPFGADSVSAKWESLYSALLES
ncbi:glycosyltransferase [Qipengyuania aquimaris]|uniref:glycosyltransferase n=1 Tax=Qipengyuania aquimaris TaxID=255984 RepID=UPI001FD23C26|nr:glycosyltransferase [Qipengyuania aquimaris]UOR14300.1 glycosyltransferase [Qipengyuania aquimaris]